MNQSAKDDDAARVEQDFTVISSALAICTKFQPTVTSLSRHYGMGPTRGCSVQSLFSWIHDAVIIADGRPQVLKDDETFAFLNGRGPNI
jgi:hypothetical protein